jgi:beta-ureidopropionase / N-carbamoyl-L-amino-acid hydrolase
MDPLRIDGERLRDDLETLATFGNNPDGGIDRSTFSLADTQARTWLAERCRQAGFSVREDGIGNLFIRTEPEDGEAAARLPVWTGSHLDSVPNGGRFDGAAGVVAAVEALRCLREQRIPLARPVEAVVWSDEEGCYQGLLGSSTLVEGLSADDLDTIMGREGRSLRRALEDSGRDPEVALRAKQEQPVAHCYLELHVEQGTRLEDAEADVGVVTGIVGLVHGHATFTGRADHAGTTAMDQRRDALRAAAAFVVALPGLPAQAGRPDAVVTCGDVRVAPGADNIVPSEAVCRLDFRDPDGQGLSELRDAVVATAHRCAAEHNTTAELHWAHLADPVAMDPGLQRLVASLSERLGYRSMAVASRAGHDAQKIAAVAPTAMLFVPSKDGRSHCPEEYTEPEQLARGADVLANAVAHLAASPPPRAASPADLDPEESHGSA